MKQWDNAPHTSPVLGLPSQGNRPGTMPHHFRLLLDQKGGEALLPMPSLDWKHLSLVNVQRARKKEKLQGESLLERFLLVEHLRNFHQYR